MFCTQCGNEVEGFARFCSKCGHEVTAAAAANAAVQPKRTRHDMDMHVNILGWLLIGSGILTAMGGMILLFASQVLRHLPIPIPPDLPIGVPHFVAGITSILGLGVLALAAGTAAAGVGLIQYRSWARTCAVIMAVLLIFHFPIGTAVAIYAFWVLFSEEGQQYYKSRSDSTMTASGL